jgi:hypothetical protein
MNKIHLKRQKSFEKLIEIYNELQYESEKSYPKIRTELKQNSKNWITLF